jgi:hypothetical protein
MFRDHLRLVLHQHFLQDRDQDHLQPVFIHHLIQISNKIAKKTAPADGL